MDVYWCSGGNSGRRRRHVDCQSARESMFKLSWFPGQAAGLIVVLAACIAPCSPAFAQTDPGTQPQPAGTDAQATPPDPDALDLSTPVPIEIDLNLINLPTTLSLKRHRSYFRLTHRFARDLRRGSFDDLASSLFSLDDGAVIGLEYRFAITGNVHAGVTRSMLAKTIQTFVKWDAVRQGNALPVSV